MTPLFSFILVNYKSADLLSLWFASLTHTQLSPDQYEVIVVNNDADEKKSLERLAQQYTFKLIHTPSNLGFGAACNLGANQATGKILSFLNPDTQFFSGDLHTVSKQFLNDASIGIIGTKLLAHTDKVQEWSAGTKVTLWDIMRNNFGFPASKKYWESDQRVAVDWVSGASLFIPRNFFQKIHGFDESFFLYFEDIDLCMRTQQDKKKVLYFPDITIKHLSGHSMPSTIQQKRYYYASQDFYFAKHRPKWEGWCIKFLRWIFL